MLLGKDGSMTYAIIDPRDGEVLAYIDGRDPAKEYAEWLEQSAAHSYSAYDVLLMIRKVQP